MYASQQTIELIYCFVLDIWLAGFKNFGKLFCQLIGFHCLGGTGFSKHTVTMRFIAWNLLFKKLTILPDGRVLVWVPHANPMKFCIILPFNYCCFWDLPNPTMHNVSPASPWMVWEATDLLSNKLLLKLYSVRHRKRKLWWLSKVPVTGLWKILILRKDGKIRYLQQYVFKNARKQWPVYFIILSNFHLCFL